MANGLPFDFLMQLMRGGGQGQFGAQQGLVDAIGGFQPGQQAFGQLMGFDPRMSEDVRSLMMGAAQNPFGTGSGAATLEQMLSTGAPTDVSGLAQAGRAQANQAFQDFNRASRERATLQGGLAGSGQAAQQAEAANRLAQDMFGREMQAQVGAQEAATGRRMGALGEARAGQALSGGLAGQVGGLENQLSGQRLSALQSAGGLEGQSSGQRLQALLGQAGAGQNLLNSQLQFGGPGMNASDALNFTTEAMGRMGQAGQNLNMMGAQGGSSIPQQSPLAMSQVHRPSTGVGPSGGQDQGAASLRDFLDRSNFMFGKSMSGLSAPNVPLGSNAAEMGRNPVAGAQMEALFGNPQIAQVLMQLFGQQAGGMAGLMG
jgi:hypothetical protein